MRDADRLTCWQPSLTLGRNEHVVRCAMPIAILSLAVVGAQFPNKMGPGRRFEIELCTPGEPIELVPEPKNPADPYAIAVFSVRGVQLGYLSAERAPWMGAQLSRGREVRAALEKTRAGAVIRVAFDGGEAKLPEHKVEAPPKECIDPELQFDDDPDPDWPEGDWLT